MAVEPAIAPTIAPPKALSMKELGEVKPDVIPSEFEKTPRYKALGREVKNAIRRDPKPFQYDADVKAAGGDAKKAFVVGGSNSEDVIASMKTVTGVDIDDLTRRSSASPGGGTYNTDPTGFSGPFTQDIHLRRSHAGFLKPGVSMRQQLLQDNRLVRSLGLAHQEIASPLLEIAKAVESAGTNFKKVDVVVNGKKYVVEVDMMPGGGNALFNLNGSIRPSGGWRSSSLPTTQGSIFNDHLFSNWAFRIMNEAGQIFRGDALTPQLIHRYGFYQGGEYRLDPRRIVEFFHLQPR